MMGAGIYVWATFESEGWNTFIDTYAVMVGTFMGLGIFLISFLGCFAAYNRKKGLAMFYAVIVFILFVGQVVAAYLVQSMRGKVEDMSTYVASAGNIEEAVTEASEIALNNAILSAYTRCCSGCAGGPPEGSNVCDNEYILKEIGTGEPEAGTELFPMITDNCHEDAPCQVVLECEEDTTSACYVRGDTPAEEGIVPSIIVDTGVCTALMNMKAVHNTTYATLDPPHFLVNSTDNGGCGGGVPSVFYAEVSSYAASMLNWVMAFFIFMAVMQSLMVLMSLYFVCFYDFKD
jgi:hypothetical protein